MTKLPILLIEAHSRCNCRCEMCDIWKSTRADEFTLAQLESQLPSIEQLGTQWVIFTGGEPLMHSDLFALCKPLRARGIRVTILSTGLLFERYAAQIAEHTDGAIVSLDGPPALHDSIRHTPGGFSQITRGTSAIYAIRPEYPISVRTVVQGRNHDALIETAAAAGALRVRSISYLAADLTSTAFNRSEPWPLVRQNEIALAASHLPALDRQLQALKDNPIVADTPAHLDRISQYFRAHLGLSQHTAPRCNAPWVSALLKGTGTVQPCFFHSAIGTLSDSSLLRVFTGTAASEFRDSLDVQTNPVCRECVCSLYLKDPSALLATS
ncbi:MAG: radical SAM protein [Bryobacteraceae bacterium]